MAYSTKESAASIYRNLEPIRNNFLRRAEKCAALTIPMLIPRGSNQRIGMIQEFDTPRQGIGARGVNHLSSRLLLTLLPPSSPFFKFKIDPFALDILTQATETEQAEVAATLSQMEDSVHMVVNVEAMRVPAAETMKHLVVSGNALTYLPEKGGMKFYPLSSYVCARDPEGDEPIEIILCESIARASLPKDILEMVDLADDMGKEGTETKFNSSSGNTEHYVKFYTRQHRESENKFEVWQELENGVLVPGSESSHNKHGAPYNAHRWTTVPGEAYGRGLVEEYLGDLISLEGLSQALVEGALAAARVVGLVMPNAQTRPQDLNDAANGEFVIGRAEDISFLQLEKFADFRTASEVATGITKRLEGAFLLNSSVIRDAERVTAEEIRFVAQELESTLGGTYTILANEFQLPLANSILARLQKTGAIPRFPSVLKGKIQPVIVTGVDALGRNDELERLRAATTILQGILGPEAVAKVMKLSPTATYVFSKAGITIKGLIKTAQEIAQEDQQAQQMMMMQNAAKAAAGPAVNAVSKATTEANGAGAPQ